MQKANRVRSVAISTSTINASAVVEGAHGMVIKVLGFFVSVSGAVNVKFQSGANDMTGLFYGAAAGSTISLPVVSDPEETCWFETRLGETLNINLSGGVAVGGVLVYKMVPGNVR